MATKRIHTCDTCGKGSDSLYAKRYFGRSICIPCQKLIVSHVINGVIPTLRFRCAACNGTGEVSNGKCTRCDLAKQYERMNTDGRE